MRRLLIIGLAALATSFALGFYVHSLTVSPDTVVAREPALPARFEAQGAVTLGCALWFVPVVTPYRDDYPPAGFTYVGMTKESVFLRIEGPTGTTLVTGLQCGLSVDWNAFPDKERPAE